MTDLEQGPGLETGGEPASVLDPDWVCWESVLELGCAREGEDSELAADSGKKM